MADSLRVLHVDMDSFFVSVEVLKDPSLRGKPVAVGDPGPRGVVASASYEARKFGIHSAMPSVEARRLCPRLIFLSGSHGEYATWSRRVREVLDEYSPLVEAASIDEFNLDLTGCRRLHGNFFTMAAGIVRRIREGLGLPCSMGLSGNRTLSKIAAKVAKPLGLLEVIEGEEESFMAPLPVGIIPGVGPTLRETLARMGVRTAGDLAAIPLRLVERVLGAWGLELHLKARGAWRGRPVSEDTRPPKSIGHETTLAEDTVDPAFLEATLFSLVERSAHRLRRKGLEAGRVTVKVRFSDFVTRTRAGSLETTSLEQRIFRGALPLLHDLTGRRMRVRLVGIQLTALRPAGYQEDLFRRGDDGRRLRACRCLDRLKERFGFEAVRWAAGH